MRKLVLAAATSLITATAVADVTPFVGVEREVNNATNRAILGLNTDLGPLDVEAKYSMTAPNNLKFEGEKVDIDVSMPVGDNLDVYMKNELTKQFKHTATVVGIKLSF